MFAQTQRALIVPASAYATQLYVSTEYPFVGTFASHNPVTQVLFKDLQTHSVILHLEDQHHEKTITKSKELLSEEHSLKLPLKLLFIFI